ncbi:hypothetical protein FNJ62_12840 [Streptomyces benahoarensis]|uniref:Beta-ketoacyl synthase C-terminal domain-containing protein n=1 Tax=Streptomyces benahoarensis TaxID=2595054 RepID=A0A553ZN45_9ACTN|nr:hypothetical protein FNJ62_12840 [Streptomyces benahoarensis]TSB42880.1 hypothetical protein FNZ23_07575 [Streptomyces benahoarensis]
MWTPRVHRPWRLCIWRARHRGRASVRPHWWAGCRPAWGPRWARHPRNRRRSRPRGVATPSTPRPTAICGVVVLKLLKDALRDGDRILAVLRGPAVNQDGRSVRLTAPSSQAQAAVFAQALERSGGAVNRWR